MNDQTSCEAKRFNTKHLDEKVDVVLLQCCRKTGGICYCIFLLKDHEITVRFLVPDEPQWSGVGIITHFDRNEVGFSIVYL